MNMWKIRKLCIEKDWFICGSNSQYEKMFEMAESEEFSTREVALAIWLCTPNVTIEEVQNELEKLGGKAND